MSGNRMLKKVLLTEMRLRFLMGLAALALFFLVLSAIFFYEWHRYGDVHAEAFGSLLTFFASIVTATVTLVYLHVTRRSLAAGEVIEASLQPQATTRPRPPARPIGPHKQFQIEVQPHSFVAFAQE